jgi:hypothetical protein
MRRELRVACESTVLYDLPCWISGERRPVLLFVLRERRRPPRVGATANLNLCIYLKAPFGSVHHIPSDQTGSKPSLCCWMILSDGPGVKMDFGVWWWQ